LAAYGGGGGDESNGQNGPLSISKDATSRVKINWPSEIANIIDNDINDYYCGGGGGGKASNENKSYHGGLGGTNNGNGGSRGVKEGSDANKNDYLGQAATGFGGGGGAGGLRNTTEQSGGKGGDGLIIIYMKYKI
jgi:hypothetical protein